MIPQSKNTKTCILQKFRPDTIFNYKFLMLSAINFNDKMFFKANKIENVISERVLSAKLQTAHLPSA